MAKFKFKYKRQGKKENKPEIEFRFENGSTRDYAFEVMSLMTILMCIVHENKDVYELVKTFMQDKNSTLYSDACLQGLNRELKHKGGDAHDEV